MQAVRNALKKIPRWILILLTLVILSACCCCLVLLLTAPPSQQSATDAPQPQAEVTNAAPLPTNTELPPATATTRPTDAPPTPVPTVRNTEPPATGLIPGLAPADVTVNMKERGFDCTTAERGELYYTTEYPQHDF